MIVAEQLSKAYRERKAVDAISFSVAKGEVFGFLGPNGAGKTTTVRMLIGLAQPTSGRAAVAGHDPVSQAREVHSSIGVVFENPNLYERLTVEDNLGLYGQLHSVPPGAVRDLIDRLELGGRRREPVSKFSKGMKQRVLIGRALLHRPVVLFLDEPTSGLDPSSASLIRDMVREMQAQGTTVFLTTHYMEEADELCDRVAFIESGRLAAVGTPASLKMQYGEKVVKLQLKGDDGGVVESFLSLDDPGTGDRISEAIRTGALLTLHSQEATLADVFIKLTGRALR